MSAKNLFEALGRESYVSLASFRKSGKEIRTPVWIAADGERLIVYTNAKSGKVKRVRAGSRVCLCACDVRGRLATPERWIDVEARMLDDDDERERAIQAIVRKYGWQMRLALLTSRLSGRYDDRAAIELRPKEAAT